MGRYRAIFLQIVTQLPSFYAVTIFAFIVMVITVDTKVIITAVAYSNEYCGLYCLWVLIIIS